MIGTAVRDRLQSRAENLRRKASGDVGKSRNSAHVYAASPATWLFSSLTAIPIIPLQRLSPAEVVVLALTAGERVKGVVQKCHIDGKL